MKVAIFSSSASPLHGYGNITLEYCSVLLKEGIDFTLFLPRSEKENAEKLSWVSKTRCILPRYVFETKNPYFLSYLKAIDVREFDVVHSLLDFPYCFMAAWSARKWKKPFFMGVQGTRGVAPLGRWPDRAVLEWCYRRAERIIVPSSFTKQMILRHVRNKSIRIQVIHNGVRFDRFQTPVQPVDDLHVRFPGKKILLTVGTLTHRKGQDLVIRALPQILSSSPDTIYVAIGNGGWKDELQRLADSLGVGHAVHFLGALDGSALVGAFQSADVYVHTPKVMGSFFEGFGIVYLEAGACGIPSVATDAGGVADAVRHGETGFIVPDEDTNAIAEKVVTLLSDNSLRTKMGEAGRRYAAEHDWSRIVPAFISLYREVTHA